MRFWKIAQSLKGGVVKNCSTLIEITEIHPIEFANGFIPNMHLDANKFYGVLSRVHASMLKISEKSTRRPNRISVEFCFYL